MAEEAFCFGRWFESSPVHGLFIWLTLGDRLHSVNAQHGVTVNYADSRFDPCADGDFFLVIKLLPGVHLCVGFFYLKKVCKIFGGINISTYLCSTLNNNALWKAQKIFTKCKRLLSKWFKNRPFTWAAKLSERQKMQSISTKTES